jgi:hypothetical protein
VSTRLEIDPNSGDAKERLLKYAQDTHPNFPMDFTPTNFVVEYVTSVDERTLTLTMSIRAFYSNSVSLRVPLSLFLFERESLHELEGYDS